MQSIFLFIILFFSQFINAKTLVISDIDDTLRWTQRLGSSLLEQLEKASDRDLIVYGMDDILNTFHKNQATIYYVTAAPSPLDELSKNFLKHHSFPQRKNFINKDWFDDTKKFKVKAITKLITREMPDQIVLIGDNGEADVSAYAQIAKNYPNVSVFIHKLYEQDSSAQVPLDQFIYLTAADLATTLEALQIFSSDETLYVLNKTQFFLDTNQTVDLLLPNWLEITEDDIHRVMPNSSLSKQSWLLLNDIFFYLGLI